MAKGKSSDEPVVDATSFEDAFGQLQKLVQGIEAGKLTLDESIATFEKGVRLAAYCRKRLEEAEGRIQQLTKEGKLEDLDRAALDE